MTTMLIGSALMYYASNASGVNASSGAVLAYPDVKYDTAGLVDSGTFVIPADGLARVTAGIRTDTQPQILQVRKNGSTDFEGASEYAAGMSNDPTGRSLFSAVFAVEEGDVIDFRYFGGSSDTVQAKHTWASIELVDPDEYEGALVVFDTDKLIDVDGAAEPFPFDSAPVDTISAWSGGQPTRLVSPVTGPIRLQHQLQPEGSDFLGSSRALAFFRKNNSLINALMDSRTDIHGVTPFPDPCPFGWQNVQIAFPAAAADYYSAAVLIFFGDRTFVARRTWFSLEVLDPDRIGMVTIASDTAIDFTTKGAFTWDTLTYGTSDHWTVGNPTRIYARDGTAKVRVHAITRGTNGNTDRPCVIEIRRNGTDDYIGFAQQAYIEAFTDGSVHVTSPLLEYTDGDYFECFMHRPLDGGAITYDNVGCALFIEEFDSDGEGGGGAAFLPGFFQHLRNIRAI